MQNYLLTLFYNFIGTAAVLAFIGYLLRETLIKYFSELVVHRFEKKLEDAKAEIRERERAIDAQFAAKQKELDHIVTFLSSQRKDRDSIVQAKRTEAAELVLRACNSIAPLTLAVEVMKLLKLEAIQERGSDRKTQEAFKAIASSLKVDERMTTIAELDLVLAKLYLNDRSIACFETYKLIMLHAVTILKCLSEGIDTTGLFIVGALRKQVEKVAPGSKEGFDTYGDSYAYYWTQYLYDETLKALRAMATGAEQDSVDLSTAKDITLASLTTQAEVRRTVAEFPEYFKSEDADLPKQGIL